jgi:hypothetical protein
MYKVLKKRIVVYFSVFLLLPGCQSKEKAEAKASEAAAEKQYLAALQFSATASKMLSISNAEEVTPVLGADKRNYAEGDGVTVRIGTAQTQSETNELSAGTPALDAEIGYDQACRKAGDSVPWANCVGHVVHGIGYISLALQGQDYRVTAGNETFQVKLPAGVQLPSLTWFEKVEFNGVLSTINGDQNSIRPVVTDAAIRLAPDSSKIATFRKAVQLYAACVNNDFQLAAQQRIDNKQDYAEGAKLNDIKFNKASLDRAKPVTGVVEIDTKDGTQICRIDGGRLTGSYIRVGVLTPPSLMDREKEKYPDLEVKILFDRSTWLAEKEKEDNERSAALENEMAKERAEFDALPDAKKFQLASKSLENSAEAIASFIGKKQNAQFYLETCNEEMRLGLDSYKSNGRASAMKKAEKYCTEKAINLCMGDYDNKACERRSKSTWLNW